MKSSTTIMMQLSLVLVVLVFEQQQVWLVMV
jgi:hypothetical protein